MDIVLLRMLGVVAAGMDLVAPASGGDLLRHQKDIQTTNVIIIFIMIQLQDKKTPPK